MAPRIGGHECERDAPSRQHIRHGVDRLIDEVDVQQRGVDRFSQRDWKRRGDQAQGTYRLATAIFNGSRQLQPKHNLIFNDQDSWCSRWHASARLGLAASCGLPESKSTLGSVFCSRDKKQATRGHYRLPAVDVFAARSWEKRGRYSLSIDLIRCI